MPEHEAAGLSAMRGSGARGDPNRAYRRYTAIPLIDYVVPHAALAASHGWLQFNWVATARMPSRG